MIIVLVERIEDLLQRINVLGFELDIWKLLIYFYLCIPLGFWFNSLRCKNQRMLFNLLIGLFFTMVITKEWFIFILSAAIVIYCVSRLFRECFLPVFLVSFAILSYCHIYRLLYDYLSWKMDYNCIQMMITARYVYYAVDREKVQDSFLMYLSYIFMFPNLYLAPLPYYSFVNLITRKEDFTNYKYSSCFKNLLKAILFSLGEVVIGSRVNTNVYLSEEWKQMNFLQKLFVTQFVSIVLRFQYFVAFKHSQAAMDAYGITYNPQTGECDRFPVADYHYDLEKNIAKKTLMWNQNVQGWLRYCFFEKLQSQFGGATYYVTFLISCVWHGFYCTYYLFFIFWAISVQVCKYFYKAQQKFYFIPETIRHIICWLWCSCTIDHLATGMKILDWDKAIEFHSSVGWVIHVQLVIVFAFFAITGYGQRRKKE